MITQSKQYRRPAPHKSIVPATRYHQALHLVQDVSLLAATEQNALQGETAFLLDPARVEVRIVDKGQLKWCLDSRTACWKASNTLHTRSPVKAECPEHEAGGIIRWFGDRFYGSAVADCDGKFVGVEGMAQDLASMPDGESSVETRDPDLQLQPDQFLVLERQCLSLFSRRFRTGKKRKYRKNIQVQSNNST